ncbi:MAG: ChbG/HpnK family deacetylase [Saprospiraceae bacterium]|nr:ChbG/HpnK family deacetylase [Saprospiraceae bacterium]
MKNILLLSIIIFLNHFVFGQTWAEKLGFPAGKKVIILHADDIGMCTEANEAVFSQLENKEIQSASAMVPCPAFEDLVEWSQKHPGYDIGLHLTLTSEWKTYRWGPVSSTREVPGLLDDNDKLWHTVRQVVNNASANEVEKEIRAQIEKSLALGLKPSHIDTHMGTLYGDNDYTEVYMKIAEEYKIPAMVIEINSAELVQKFRQAGYPITERLIQLIEDYSLPKLDYFTSVPSAGTYAEKCDLFYKLIDELPSGLSEIIFHPSIYSDNLKTITNSWQQRVWEAEMFADPEVRSFLKDRDIIFTNWKEIMQRFASLKD